MIQKAQIADSKKNVGVIHVALNPQTGPWSVMRDLGLAQSRSGRYGTVALGVIRNVSWPAEYHNEALASGLLFFSSKTPEIFGTGSFLLQRVITPPIEAWVGEMAEKFNLSTVIIHFHNAWMSGVFLPLKINSIVTVKCIVTFHGVNAFLQDKPIRLALHRWMAARLVKYRAVLTSVDRANLERAESELLLPASSFSVIPNGVKATALRVQTRTDVEGCCLIFGHIGSISHQKGWRLTAEAVINAHTSGFSCKLVIAGTGPEATEARALAEANPECISFMGHVCNPRETLMPFIDVLCLLSDHEGLPMAIIEAMSVGLPVIATDVGGVSEAVCHGKTGYLIPKSSNVLRKIIKDLCARREPLARLSQQSLVIFSERFEITRIVAAYHSVYLKDD
jgi:glycosyltransferase involved in cell wall biosynthesis